MRYDYTSPQTMWDNFLKIIPWILHIPALHYIISHFKHDLLRADDCDSQSGKNVEKSFVTLQQRHFPSKHFCHFNSPQ